MSGPVEQYLACLAARDFAGLAETLAADVHRVGPYGDVVEGRDAYVEFLDSVISSLENYRLDVTRTTPTGFGVIVELTETVDDRGVDLRTEEVVVFETRHGLIAEVHVYIRTVVPALSSD